MTIEKELAKYPDVPRSVLLKYEFQRCGVKMGQSALEAVQEMDDIYAKGEFMFSWDSGKRKTKTQKIPFTYYFERDDTFFLNRTNDESPYSIQHFGGNFAICENDKEVIEKIYFGKKPKYCNEKTSDGVPMSQVAQPLGDMLFCTIHRYCEMWKDGDQCLFCDFGSVAKEQAKTRESVSILKSPEQIAETLECALQEVKPNAYRHIYFSGGSVLSEMKGQSEVDFYCNIMNAIGKRIKCWYGSVLQVGPPEKKDDWKRYYDTGIPAIQPNLEVWDRDLFKVLCPGKEKHIGYDEFIRRLLGGAEVFGWGRVIPNFVCGVEMAKPWGFGDVDSAVKSTLGGFEFLMQNGILPRCAIWLIESGSALSGQEPPPLEYYVKLGRGYKDLRKKYNFGDNLVALCRGCNPQDTLHDWDYAEKQQNQRSERC